MSSIPIAAPEDLTKADTIIFGTPTRFGNMCGQMRQFLDATGQLWLSGVLVGKVWSVFVSTATQHGGHESTILSFHTTLLHHGMIIVGLPYAYSRDRWELIPSEAVLRRAHQQPLADRESDFPRNRNLKRYGSRAGMWRQLAKSLFLKK